MPAAATAPVRSETADDLRLIVTSLQEEKTRLTEENDRLRTELARLTAPLDTGPLLPPPPFAFSGAIGGPFMISGVGFGNDIRKGSLLIAGRTVPATRWKDHNIKGVLPADLKPGSTEVIVNGTKVTVSLA